MSWACSFSTLHRGVFLRVLRFPPLLKNQHLTWFVFQRLCSSARTTRHFNKVPLLSFKSLLTSQKAIRPALISGFRSMKRLGVFILPPGWDASPSQGYPQHFAGTHLYPWVERGTVRVKCLAQEHNTMSPARPRTTRSGVERTNHEATAPPFTTAKLSIFWGDVFVDVAVVVDLKVPIVHSGPT